MTIYSVILVKSSVLCFHYVNRFIRVLSRSIRHPTIADADWKTGEITLMIVEIFTSERNPKKSYSI